MAQEEMRNGWLMHPFVFRHNKVPDTPASPLRTRIDSRHIIWIHPNMRSKGALALIALIVLVAIVALAGCGTYNSLVQADETVKESWGNVQTQYQRRADLVPNLVNTVRGAANFERETLEAVIEARSRAVQVNLSEADLDNPERMTQFMAAQGQLSGALGRLFAVAEQYPELRAVDAFLGLQDQLEGTENRINYARTQYNASVRNYNSMVRRFPTAIFAGLMGFSPRVSFEADPGAEQAPTVDFS